MWRGFCTSQACRADRFAGRIHRTRGTRRFGCLAWSKYRLWIVNNGPSDAAEPFDVSLIATAGEAPTESSPYVTRRVAAMKSGERLTVELQLPAEVMQIQTDGEGSPLPFQNLFAGIDTNQEYTEVNEENNALAVAGDSVPKAELLAVSDK